MSFVNSIFIICLILACQWELILGGPRKVHPPPIPYHRKHVPPRHGYNQFQQQHHGKHPSLPPANDFQKAHWGCSSLECSLNSALNPCDDFYEFVCSGFMKNTGPLPEGFSTKSQFNLLWHRSYNDLIGILGNQTIRQTASTLNPLFHQMFLFYDTCLDGPGREASRSQGLLAHLAETSIEPGTLRQFNTDWLLKAYPFVPFFDLDSTWDVRPETEEEKDVAKREEFAQKMAKVLGYLIEDDLANVGKKPVFVKRGLSNEEYSKDIQRRVHNLIQMEMRIGEILDSSQEQQEWERFSNLSKPERYTNLSALGQLYSPHSLDWHKLLGQFGPFVPESELKPSSKVIVLGHELLLSYGQMIKKLEEEEPQMLSDYLDWCLIWPILSELDSRFTELLEEPGTPARNERICVRDYVRIYFPHLLDILYVKNVFEKELIGKNHQILSFVKNGFSELLDEADWMNAEWKKKAKLKLANLKDNIGYFPTVIENDELLARLYANYDIKEGMPWAQMYAHVKRQVYLWPAMDYKSSYWVDGYYKWVYNSLAIYAGIINPPWFDPSQPAVMNFGSMGTFIGHEVTHGYDSLGWHFDERGKLRSMHEAESGQEMMQKMDQRMECFVRQYGQYGDESRRSDGRFTLSENIADNGGIRASYKAWQRFKATNPEEARRKPEGFQEFTDQQLLFISSAFMYCSQMPETDAVSYGKNDNHAFPRSRVNLPLRNFNSFAQAFECPIGSHMNPAEDEEKCRLW